MANTSFVLMLAREPAHVAFGARHGVELDKHDNPLLRFDRDLREWSVARRFDTRLAYVHDMSAGSRSSGGSGSGGGSVKSESESGWRPLRLVVAVAGDVNLGEIRPRPRWMTVYRMEKVCRSLFVCSCVRVVDLPLVCSLNAVFKRSNTSLL